jgi:tetratricopeptide (TPR) repeat protein
VRLASDDPAADQKLATGDAVNVAARLEQAAAENQILLGDVTYRLVRDAVEVQAVEPLQLRGKTQRVAAFRLVAAPGLDGLVRRHDRPLVGRDAELATLAALFGEVLRERSARLVTVIGDAGFGKSRLVREVIDRIAVGARVLSGRCLPYGDGITFWPLLMMVREAADIGNTDSPEVAQAKLRQAVGDSEVADRLASAAGLTTASFPLAELNWAARKFFERWASAGPLVAFVDDIHWAQPAFLDLLEHVQATAVDAPILLLTTARHDLIEARAEWGTQPGSVRLVLQPLADDAATQVVANLLGSAGLSSEVMRRIVEAAEGNPLYAEQMLSMLIDSGVLQLQDGRWVRADDSAEIAVPPSIHALLEARLDGLGRAERAAVEPASVIGLEFAQSPLESLAPPAVRAELPAHLVTLTRQRFIRPAQSAGAELIYRFHHHLVRETVYNGLLKRARATLHLEFVRWADRANADSERGLEFEEILGYHLEQAHKYLSELGPLDEQGTAIGIDAGARLSHAGYRAAARGDLHAAANLLGRAIALFPIEEPRRLPLLPELAEVLMDLGDFEPARALLGEAAVGAERFNNSRVRAAAQLVRLLVRLYSGEPVNWGDETVKLTDETIPMLLRESAHEELAKAWRLIAMTHQIAGRLDRSAEAIENVIHFAGQAGNQRLVARSGVGLSLNALYGPTPVAQAIQQCERIVADSMLGRQSQALIQCKMAQLLAMSGDFESARTMIRRGRGMLRELGQGMHAASTGLDLAVVEWLAGDLQNAEREIRSDFQFLERHGETFMLSTMASLLARLVREQGRDDEALVLTQTAEAAAAANDVDAQVLWRSTRAPILARSGAWAEAEAMGLEALEQARQTDVPILLADTLCELAAVQRLANRSESERTALVEAIALYTAKGDRVSAARATARVSRLDAERAAPNLTK